MDFLNTTFKQLNDLFQSMTVGARITAGLLLVMVVVSFGYLFNHQVAGGDSYLLGGQHFSTSELNAMEQAFSKAGLGGYTLEGGRIRIPRSQQHTYVAALAEDQALPMNWGDHLIKAMESSNVMMGQKERDDRLLIAKQQNLALVLRSMRDVANANVQYDSQKKPGLGQQRIATASVMMQLVGGRTLDEQRVAMIREMVRACFADLTPDKVTISDLQSGRVYAGDDIDGMGAGGSHKYITTKVAFQKDYEMRIQAALAFVPGITVAANVELEKEMYHTTHSLKHDPQTVPLSINEQFSTTKSEAAPTRGGPGLGAQQPTGPNQSARVVDAAKGSTNEVETSNSQQQNVVNRTDIKSQQIGLTPRRVTVSVGVPTSYFEDVWRRQNPTPEGEAPKTPDAVALANIETEEMAKIRNHVVPLIPKQADQIDPTPQVTVSKFFPIVPPAMAAPGAGAGVMSWLADNWSSLGLAALAVVSLAMLRSMIRSAPPELRPLDFGLPRAEPEAMAAEAATAAAVAAAVADTPKNRLKRRVASGTSLRDELVEMVREDPDAAANILRGWIGNAS